MIGLRSVAVNIMQEERRLVVRVDQEELRALVASKLDMRVTEVGPFEVRQDSDQSLILTGTWTAAAR